MSESIIHIEALYKKYKEAEDFSVNNLSLVVAEKEIFGLLGPNGAGKTTLISMLCGLVKPTSGKFTINGLSYDKNATEIKKIIGVVPQEYALYPTLTARENLIYFGSMYGLKGKELRTKVDTALEHLGLLKFANKKVDTFSGGMKRRVNLIAGILHEPKVLFLDEPTVGVDVQSKHVIIEYLKELNENGTTIIYTSHHLTEAQDFCSHIAIIDRGNIYAQGTPEGLIAGTPNSHNLEDVFISLTGKELRDDA
ncbi:ABC transporter ATP-binding protein [Flavobacterium sp. H122]|uniref:ABC transporter ATP-binding protein n=1 Tax=Flavobacterium sp. H122 TaxID=2529860 RepID=UPI0010A998A9|nr:ABC transporter ATP-binding protein [Flavobacterium sp. H122]